MGVRSQPLEPAMPSARQLMKRNPRAGLFNGYWLDMQGNRIRRIYRTSTGELYRLERKHQDVPRYGRHTQAAALGVQPISYRGPWHA